MKSKRKGTSNSQKLQPTARDLIFSPRCQHIFADYLDVSMSSAQDPFYIVKEEIQDSIDKLLSTFHQWERTPSDSGEQLRLNNELLAGCESIEWQVDELDKTIAVAAKDPSWYGIDEVELDKRRRWTSNARTQVRNVKKSLTQNESNGTSTSTINGMRRELMRISDSHQAEKSNQYHAQDNDDFITSESDRQLLLIRQQDEELDELSASVQRIGDVGLTIHEELLAQEKIIDELGTEMEGTSNRLDFVQKKVAMVMKKAGAKGQFMMILFLLALFIVLFVLVFFT
ncbi:syntaxin [Sesamum alatum]|uniref:Syntaxin n=1 Tax=Sesamum alatum TaxID=300844 RepID=A0AAE2CLP1_9LAMI|nr:syntaxin [Sesamum alatum]